MSQNVFIKVSLRVYSYKIFFRTNNVKLFSTSAHKGALLAFLLLGFLSTHDEVTQLTIHKAENIGGNRNCNYKCNF